MKYPMKKSLLAAAITTGAIIASLSGCSDSPSSGAEKIGHINGRETISVEYVNAALKTKLNKSYSHEGTFIAHIDTIDGSAIDLGNVIISKVSSATTGEQLAFAYDAVILELMPINTVATLYLDTDDGATGEPINGIMADTLVVETNESTGQPTSSVYTYSGSWVGDTIIDNDSILENVSLGITSVIVASTTTPSLVLGKTDIKGVLALRSYTDGDPNTVATTSDTTTPFSFSTP